MRIPIIVILGPTAVGKTAMSLALGERLDAEIISADSAMVYRYLDIGTAKPSAAERRVLAHHLIDICNPDEEFTAADFQRLAAEVITDTHRRGRRPMVVGGTGFYIRALIGGYPFPALKPDWELRSNLTQEAGRIGNQALHRRLAAVDPRSAGRLHPNDTRRVVRALEVFARTGTPLSAHRQRTPSAGPYEVTRIGLFVDREVLYRRIDERVDEHIRQGLENEVRQVLASGFRADCWGLQSLGYRQMVQYIEGRLSLDEAVRLIKRDTRHFARRQVTWFKREPKVEWLDVTDGIHNAAIERAYRVATGKI